jgi:hypothetical protein
MTANGSWTYSVSINLNTAKFTWTVSDNGGLQPSINPLELYEKLGFNSNTTYTFVGDSLSSINVCDMSPENDIFIRSNLVAGGYNNNDNVLIDLQGSGVAQFGRIQFYNPEPAQYVKDINNTSDIYEFQITDEDGNIKKLNGINYTATILFFKKSTLPSMIKDLIKLVADIF